MTNVITQLAKAAGPDIPRLCREAERRVNEHVWGDRRALVSIPADVSRDVDIVLLTAADEIDRLNSALRTVYRLAGGHATECKCQQCAIFEFLEPIVGNTSAVEPAEKP